MVHLSVSGGNLVLHVRGSRQAVGAQEFARNPAGAYCGDQGRPVRCAWLVARAVRMPGTNIPGVITAGTSYQHGQRVFWDVHNPENTIVIELRDERYNELIVEVADPQATVELVKSVLPRQTG